MFFWIILAIGIAVGVFLCVRFCRHKRLEAGTIDGDHVIAVEMEDRKRKVPGITLL